MLRIPTVVAIILVASCALSAGVAADPNAPPWRGTVGSTFQDWGFSTNSRPTVPESFSNPFGTSSAAINYMPPWSSGWYNTLPGVYGAAAQGWWDISAGSIVLNILNHPDLGVSTSKDFQVQVVYWDDINKAPTVLVTPTATFIGKTTTLVASGPVGGAWYLDKWTFHVDPNLNSETITVKGHATMGSQIDRIVADTRYKALVDNAGLIRTFPDETVVDLTGPVVTRSFDSFFYLESRDRSSGIRVNCATGQSPAAEMTAPEVSGIVRTIDGERVIDDATIVAGGSGNVLPLGMNCVAVRMGLVTQGLFVRLTGRADVESPSASTFTVNDGSAEAVAVELHGVLPPANGDYVAVTGVLGANSVGPVLRVGQSDTIVKLD